MALLYPFSVSKEDPYILYRIFNISFGLEVVKKLKKLQSNELFYFETIKDVFYCHGSAACDAGAHDLEAHTHITLSMKEYCEEISVDINVERFISANDPFNHILTNNEWKNALIQSMYEHVLRNMKCTKTCKYV